jgi:hypothetical protein
MSDSFPAFIATRYSRPWIEGAKITRLEEKRLADFRLDAVTAWQLGRQNLGVFVGNCGSLDRTLDTVHGIVDRRATVSWILIVDEISTARYAICRWRQSSSEGRPAPIAVEPPYAYGNLIITTPERLKSARVSDCGNVAATIVLDTLCEMHKTWRGLSDARWTGRKDLPQLIANFRSKLAVGNWVPPLVLLTDRSAKSVNSSAIARAFCLDGWWFLRGRSFRCAVVKADAVRATEVSPSDGSQTGDDKNEPTRDMKGLTGHRASLLSERTRLKNRLHMILAQRSIKRPCDDLLNDKALDWLAALDVDARARLSVESDLRLLAAIEQELATLDKLLSRQAQRSVRS